MIEMDAKSLYLKCEYHNDNFDVDFYPNFLTPELAQRWYEYLENMLPHSGRRNSVLFGDDGLVYTVNYREITNKRTVSPWTDLPALSELKSLVESITDQKYTVCIIQRYPNGNIGIAPHRDKEMVLGTRICGLSLGATRTISFIKTTGFKESALDPAELDLVAGYKILENINGTNNESIEIPLNSGSMYVMNPPTNQKWLHSIVKDNKVKEPRISLTFRDYEG